MDRIKRFNNYIKEDMIDDKEPEIQRFGEYRKGSGEFGSLIDKTMTWLRNYKNDPKITKIRTNLNTFLEQSDINIEELNNFLERQKETNLINFNIEILNDKIQFSGLNNSKKNRYVWEKNKNKNNI